MNAGGHNQLCICTSSHEESVYCVDIRDWGLTMLYVCSDYCASSFPLHIYTYSRIMYELLCLVSHSAVALCIKYEKHFQKMYRDVGMAVPKTKETRCRDGSVQGRHVIQRLHN